MKHANKSKCHRPIVIISDILCSLWESFSGKTYFYTIASRWRTTPSGGTAPPRSSFSFIDGSESDPNGANEEMAKSQLCSFLHKYRVVQLEYTPEIEVLSSPLVRCNENWPYKQDDLISGLLISIRDLWFGQPIINHTSGLTLHPWTI